MSGYDGYDGFIPEYPAFHQPFWDSVADRHMKIQRCTACGTFRFIPIEICPRCHDAGSTWTEVSGRGEIYTYTIVHRAPAPFYQAQAPYALAYVTLEEGPRMMSRVRGCALDEVRVGMPVEVGYDDVAPGLTLYHFRPVPLPGS